MRKRRYDNHINKYVIALTSFFLGLGMLLPNPIASAPRSRMIDEPCPSTVVLEPPPCVYKTQGTQILMDCAAPGVYWFSSVFAGFGCAGNVSNIKLGMARVEPRPGIYTNKYILEYTLYTGNGFQKDTGGFHIDVQLADGSYIQDILGGRIDFDFGRCYYPPGQKFRVPSSGFPGVTNFDFTRYNIYSLIIRVDRAIGASNAFHC